MGVVEFLIWFFFGVRIGGSSVSQMGLPSGGARKVCIDPGHQDHEMKEEEPIGPGASQGKKKLSPGTKGTVSGKYEYEVVLEIGLKLKTELERRGYEVSMTRSTNNVNLSNVDRAQYANGQQSEVFLRLHCDYNTDASRKGVHAIAPANDNPYLEEKIIEKSQKLADILAASQAKATGQVTQTNSRRNDLTGINWAKMPVTIVEMGFMSNVEEDRFLTSTDGQGKIVKGLADGARTSLTALIACICAGIIVGVCTMTGLGAVISYNIMQLSGGSLFVALCLTAIASIILSMGLPATACYIMVAIVIAPALVKMGATQLAAHFFVFYFSCISNITPPVAIAAYTAAGLCGDKPVKVAWQAMKIAAPGFFIPFLLVYNPILLWTASMNLEMLMAVVTAAIGVVVIAIAGVGYIFGNTNIVFRIGYALGAVCLVLPGTATDLIGTAVILLFGIMDYVGSKRMNKQKQAE